MIYWNSSQLYILILANPILGRSDFLTNANATWSQNIFFRLHCDYAPFLSKKIFKCDMIQAEQKGFWQINVLNLVVGIGVCLVLEIFRILQIFLSYSTTRVSEYSFLGKDLAISLFRGELGQIFNSASLWGYWGGNITGRMTLSGYYEVFQPNFWDIKRRLNSR